MEHLLNFELFTEGLRTPQAPQKISFPGKEKGERVHFKIDEVDEDQVKLKKGRENLIVSKDGKVTGNKKYIADATTKKELKDLFKAQAVQRTKREGFA